MIRIFPARTLLTFVGLWAVSCGSTPGTAATVRAGNGGIGKTTAWAPGEWHKESGRSGEARFRSPDGSAFMAVWGIADDGRSLRGYIRKIARDGGVTVTYAPTRRNWFVLSGYRNGRIFYSKVIRACGGIHHLAVEYRAADKRRMDPIVTRMSRSLSADC